MNLILLTIVFVSSLVLTMVGLGGGLIFAPAFVLLGMAKSQAVAASLFLNGMAALSAVVVYIRKGLVDYSTALPLLIASALFAPIGAWFTHRLDLTWFTLIMAGVVFAAAARMLFGSKPEEDVQVISRARRIGAGAGLGAVIGTLGGMLGIGGGVFIVPLMIYILKTPAKVAAASSIFIVCFSSFSGFAAHAGMVKLDWPFLIAAGVCTLVAGQIGSRLMVAKLKGPVIKRIFGVVLLGLGLKLLHGVLWG